MKKIVDDLPAILNLAETSADASRYLMYGKGGWPHEPTEPVAFMEEAVGRVIKKTKEIRANENDTESS